MQEISIEVQRLPHAVAIPAYQSENAAGVDLYAAHQSLMAIQPMERFLVPTGIAVAIPEGYQGEIRPRSGLAFASGLTVLNTPGTIDSDYRGEIKVLLINLGSSSVVIRHGDRIAQMVFMPVVHASFVEVEALSETARGEGGFGSTDNQPSL